MRILILSHAFSPSVGGIEAVAETLVDGLLARGHAVRIATMTKGDGRPERVDILRRPGLRDLFAAVRWADVVLHNNPSLRMIWPSVALNRPTVIMLHTWLRRSEARIGWRNTCKRLACRWFTVAAASQVLADDFKPGTPVIHGCLPTGAVCSFTDNGSGIVFAGRLVPDKGAALLVDAHALLARQGTVCKLTMVGTGPELQTLQQQAAALGTADLVHFHGEIARHAVVELMQSHQVVAAPSRWREPFGLVALEAASAGRAVVVPEDTGLVEAAGPAAVTFRRGDVDDLTRALKRALEVVLDLEMLSTHCRQHSPDIMLDAYEHLLVGATERNQARSCDNTHTCR